MSKSLLRSRGALRVRLSAAALSIAAVTLALTACAADPGSNTPGTGPDGSSVAPSDSGPDLGLLVPGKLTATSLRSQVPMSYVDANGEPIGFAVELAKEVAERLGLEIEFTLDDVAAAISGVVTEKYDIMVAAVVQTEERQETMDFSMGWYWAPSVIISLEENPYPDIEDLFGKTVAVVQATAQEAQLHARFPEITAQVFADQTAAVTALKGRQVDAALLGGVNSLTVAEEEPSIILGAEVEETTPSGFVLPKGNTALADAVNAAIQDIIDDGTFMELWDAEVPFPPSEMALETFPALRQ